MTLRDNGVLNTFNSGDDGYDGGHSRSPGISPLPSFDNPLALESYAETTSAPFSFLLSGRPGTYHGRGKYSIDTMDSDGHALPATSALRELSDRSDCIHNFSGDPVSKWSLEALATGGDCEDGCDHLGKEIDLEYVYIHKVEITGDNGEIQEPFRTVLFPRSGNPIGFVSDGVARQAYNLLDCFRDKPIPDDLRVVVKSKKTNKGRTFYSLSPVGIKR